MFSEAHKTLDMVEKVIDEATGYLRHIPPYTSQLERRLMYSLIESKGREEAKSYTGPVHGPLLPLVFSFRFLGEKYDERKVDYVQMLFSMTPSYCYKYFYDDLRLGLDYVIGAWDGSREDPYRHFFTKPPTGYRRRVFRWFPKT